MKMRYLFSFIITCFSFSFAIAETSVPQAQNEGVYPYGTKFPLFLYAINGDWAKQSGFGWNVGHTYSTSFHSDPLPFIINCKNAGLLTLGILTSNGTLKDGKTPKTEEEISNEIKTLASTDNISWWDIPEELRIAKPGELEILKNYPAWTRKYDTKQLPTFMYIPGHYSKERLQPYVQYLDILPVSCYTTYYHMTPSFIRWSVERAKAAVIAEGKTLGKDYKNGQKTVMAILECFSTRMTPAESWHDFWLAVACDVRGIGVYSYFYSTNDTNRYNCYTKLEEAVSKFTGKEQLNRVLIEGIDNSNIKFTITAGPDTTSVTPHPQTKAGVVVYPSLTVLGKNWQGNTYIVAVNSSFSPLTANISGISTSRVAVLFENRLLSAKNGSFSDKFDGLGVHIYKISL